MAVLRRAVLALAALALGAAPAAAQESGALTRELRASLGGSLGPAGVQNGFDLSWTRGLTDSRSLLLRDAHVAFGASSRLTPAYARVGPWVELAPLSILDVRAGVDAVGFFGTFHSPLSFGAYGEPFDDDTRRARDDAEAALGTRVYVAPSLKARAGALTFRARAELEWWNVDTDGPFFYEPFRDTLLRASGDGLVATETILLWSLRRDEPHQLMIGPVHEMVRVYDARANRRQLLGLVGVWGLGARRLGVRSPVLFVKAARYMEDPNREGDVTLQAGLAALLGGR